MQILKEQLYFDRQTRVCGENVQSQLRNTYIILPNLGPSEFECARILILSGCKTVHLNTIPEYPSSSTSSTSPTNIQPFFETLVFKFSEKVDFLKTLSPKTTSVVVHSLSNNIKQPLQGVQEYRITPSLDKCHLDDNTKNNQIPSDSEVICNVHGSHTNCLCAPLASKSVYVESQEELDRNGSPLRRDPSLASNPSKSVFVVTTLSALLGTEQTNIEEFLKRILCEKVIDSHRVDILIQYEPCTPSEWVSIIKLECSSDKILSSLESNNLGSFISDEIVRVVAQKIPCCDGLEYKERAKIKKLLSSLEHRIRKSASESEDNKLSKYKDPSNGMGLIPFRILGNLLAREVIEQLGEAKERVLFMDITSFSALGV